MVSLHQS